MKIKEKILLPLIMIISMIKPSIAGPYVEEGHIDLVTMNMSTYYCTLRINGQLGNWYCNNIAGKAMFDLAKIAHILNKPAKVTFMSGFVESKDILDITLE
ncbi:Uncharacterised protein [Bartonella doshiae]|uniref:Uncharacterized protein n=3 Tax=Bartonella doshiae TaxID=33044 RepID=A0A380ZCW9_BARDO|nr:hypothetical protein MCS_01333 [Bartonella doshiae NCTC 12862 = ATCC 700133]SUV44360.1 Uncharacterised protein [Bartonella doshiae]